MSDEHQSYYVNMNDEQSLEYIEAKINDFILKVIEALNTYDPKRPIVLGPRILNNLTPSAYSELNDFKKVLNDIGLFLFKPDTPVLNDGVVDMYFISQITAGNLSEQAIENDTVEKKVQYLEDKYPDVTKQESTPYKTIIEKYEVRPD